MKLNKVKEAFYIDKNDKNDFNHEITNFNKCVLYVICVFTFIVECVTMSRIFIVSSVKLGSLNNRIYFAFYLVLIIISIFIFFTQLLNKNKKNKNYSKLLFVQYIFIFIYCIWSMAFNIYELERNVYIWQYINGMIIASVFLYLKPTYIISLLVSNHIIFTLYLIHMNKNGIDMTSNIVNSNIILVALIFVSISRYVGKLQDFKSRKKLLVTNYKLEQLNGTLNSLTITDALSKLNNRRYFDEKLQQCWDECIQNEHLLTIIMIDIDNFKNFNDVYGHQTGDDCIVQVASVLKNLVTKKDDIVVRYGGEEFTIILIDCTKQQSKVIADNICNAVQDLKMPNEIKNKITNNEQYVTISLGIHCDKPTKDHSAIEFVDKADKALYMAKENGKNQSKIF